MREILLDDKCETIGVQGEANVACIRIDAASLYEEWPSGVPAMLVLRRDGELYPVVCAYDAVRGCVCHMLTGADMALDGVVKFELQWLDGERIAKRRAYYGYVAKSLGNPEMPPEEPVRTWVQALQADVGDLSDLITTEKSSLVGAVNETREAVPTRVSQLENDSGYIDEETDPTVPAWAKASQKPSYTAVEVGALPIAQGVSLAGAFMVVGTDGNITAQRFSIWEGGSY